ncbi:hypothetical protein MHTCC0001_14340 [Flavobacteriaceae bacterium MHTCC 0001]
MKTKLLSLFVLIYTLGFSQSAVDIEQLHSVDGSQFTVMDGTIDQSPTGANVSWDFTGLTTTSVILTDTYDDSNTNAPVIETRDGATLISSINLSRTIAQFSITGALSQGVEITYTNPGLIGTFPLSYNYSNTDQIEGTFTSTDPMISGTILNTSDIEVEVDAWGTLEVGSFDGEVTRLKVIQNLDFNALFQNFPGTITSYFYYDASSNDLVFRYTRVQVTPPIGDPIDNTLLEALSSYTLSSYDKEISDFKLRLTSNPITNNALQFETDTFTTVRRITISDVMGRKVLQGVASNKLLDISGLKSGLYVATFETNGGTISLKFIKQ